MSGNNEDHNAVLVNDALVAENQALRAVLRQLVAAEDAYNDVYRHPEGLDAAMEDALRASRAFLHPDGTVGATTGWPTSARMAVERLEKRLEAWRREAQHHADDAAELRERVRVLTDALRPFAELGNGENVGRGLTAEDFQAARVALAQTEGERPRYDPPEGEQVAS